MAHGRNDCFPSPARGSVFLSEGYKDIIAWIYCEFEAKIKATVAIPSTYNVPDQSFGRYDPKQ